MDWIHTKYIQLVSPNLRNFKRKSNELYNFSCEFCGDSQRDKRKARGYIYENNGKVKFKCHNCNKSLYFDSFLKHIDPNLFNQFKFEIFKENNPKFIHQQKSVVKPEVTDDLLNYVSPVIQNDEAIKYLESRKIPKEKWNKIYFSNNLKNISNIFNNKAYDEIKFYDEPRLILPIYSINNKLIGIISRSIIQNTKLRYLNLRIDNDDPMIYNLNNVDMSMPKIIVEGAFDSLFLKNSLAVDGSDFNKASKYIDKDKDILVFDNQNRNKELIKQIEKMISLNYRICIWPENINGKDINEMILNGVKNIQKIIEINTFEGLNLKLKFAEWRKIG